MMSVVHSVTDIAAMTKQQPRREIAFIDPGVEDLAALLLGLRPEVEGILLDACEPAPRLMARVLSGRQGLDAVHVIAHGLPGEVSFSAGPLSVETIGDHEDALEAIGQALGNGELLLWSCDTGSGRRGEAFTTAIGKATGAEVAAAAGLVGAAARGGLWQLDATPHRSKGRPPLTADSMESYRGVMTRWSNIVITGVGNNGVVNAAAASSGFNITGTGDYEGSPRQYPVDGTQVTIEVFLDGVATQKLTATIENINVHDRTFTWVANDTTLGSINPPLAQGQLSIQVVFPAPNGTFNDNAVASINTFDATYDTVDPAITKVTDSTHSPDVVAGNPVTITVDFSKNVIASSGLTLQLSGGGTATYASGSGGNELTFTYTPAVSRNHVKITGIASGTLTDADGNPVTNFGETICFYPGTRIATPDGERPVETLTIGDLVLTREGQAVPVRWMGRQSVSTLFADPLRVLPVRIAAGALGDSLPLRDLLVSPDHALLVDGILIQAGALVNGSTILRDDTVPERFTYWHVELADHSLILAEGVPAETFIDNVDRLAFDNWDEHQALYGNLPSIAELPLPRAKAARQVPVATRSRIAERASRVLVGVAA